MHTLPPDPRIWYTIGVPATGKRVVLAVVLIGLGIAAGSVGTRRALAERRASFAGAQRLFGSVDVRDVQLAFFAQERVERVLVEEGARVEAGELLASLQTERLVARMAGTEARIAAQRAALERLENGTRPQEVEQARAELAASEAVVASAERELERLEATIASGASSAQRVDDARAALDVARATARVRQEALALALEGPRQEDLAQARANLAALEADLRLQQVLLSDSELRAPAAGVVQSRILEPGDMASPERPVFTLALMDPKWVRAWVPEPELARVASGMRASVHADAFGGKSYAGWVGFVSPVAEFTPKSVETEDLRTQLVYEVRVFVEDPDDELRLGMPVTVDVDSEGGTDHAPDQAPDQAPGPPAHGQR